MRVNGVDYPAVNNGNGTWSLAAGTITALAQGVLYVPGEYCFGPDPRRQAPRNQFRLTYGTVNEAAIEEGVARLAKAVRIVYAKSRLGAKAH